MGDPLSATVDLVSDIIARVKDVKTNRKECTLLENLAKRMLTILLQQKMTEVGPALETTLQPVNDALEEAKGAVEKCCNANLVSAILYHQSHSSALKNAATKLEYTLSQIPVALHGKNTDLQRGVHALSSQMNPKKFEDRVEGENQRKVLKDQLKDLLLQSCKGNVEAKERIWDLAQKHLSDKEELKEKMERFMKEAFPFSENKEKQLKFELQLDEIVVALYEPSKVKDLARFIHINGIDTLYIILQT